MKYVLLDTNAWIYLANGYNTEKTDEKKPSVSYYDSMFNDTHIKTFNDLKSKTRKGEFTVLINDVIINEWNRNLMDTEQLIKELNNVKIANEKITGECKFMDSHRLSSLLEEGNKRIGDIIKKQKKHIANVTAFLHKIKNKISISDDLKISTIHLALEKQIAPFHIDKNNVADALILYSALDFIKGKNSDDSLIFVTYNFKDFCESREKENLHQSLSSLNGVDKITIEFNLARALKSDASLIENIDSHNNYRVVEHLVFDWLEKEYFNDNLETNVKIGMNEVDALIERKDPDYRIGFEIKFSSNLRRSLHFALNQLERLLQITSFNEFNIILVGQNSPNRKHLFVNTQLITLSEFYGLTINIIFGEIINGEFQRN
jgi:hypothetical protein